MAVASVNDKHRQECQSLLITLKNTVEVLLENQSANVWNTYGGLSRLTRVVANILCHRLNNVHDPNDCWNFILGLRVLVPTLAPWLEKHRLNIDGNCNRSYLWLQQRLQELSLSSYLRVLLDDHGHLKACYLDGAFIRKSSYAEAMLTCLKAVEDNKLQLLAEIEPSLLVNAASHSTKFLKKHGRSPSLPINALEISRQNGQQTSKSNHQNFRACNLDSDTEVHQRTKYLNKVGITPRVLPKSTTWHFNLHNLTSEPLIVDLKEEMEIGIEPRTKSTICSSSRSKHFTVVPLRRWRSDSYLVNNDELTINKFLTRSLPCVSIKLNNIGTGILLVSDSGVKNVETSSQANSKPDSDCIELQPDTTKVMRSPSHTRSRSDIGVRSYEFSKIDDDTGNVFNNILPMSASLPNVFKDSGQTGDAKDYPQPQIFKRPMEGQSLTSFLSSQDFKTCAELDKENAHFSISEALIAAIEQIKCNQLLKIAEEEDQDSDDEEIKHLKQRIRIRRRQKLQEKFEFRNPLLSDGCTDTTTTSQTPSPCSTSSDKSNNSDSVDPLDLSDGSEIDSKLSTLHETGLSLSMASLYSDADIQRPVTCAAVVPDYNSNKIAESGNQCLSAESVALNLLKQFSEKQLPKASDLEWLVSEQDAPQQLLPLPSSWPVSPDDAEDDHYQLSQVRIRGNLQWAPPRPQIIFNIHPSPQRKVIMAKQNFLCAGCGTKVEQGFMKRFRYCEYWGKYFCQCCHNNNLMHIPSRILKKWDFNKYSVSNFSMDLLQKFSCEPLFDINQLNPALYRRVKALSQVFQLRLQLYSIKDFIKSCRNCENLENELQKLPAHILENPHLYSVVDLIQVKNGTMTGKLKPIVTQTISHISQCPLCQGRGFFCEFCKNHNDLIFPFQIGSVIQCPGCWTCFHLSCFAVGKCPKCARIEARKIRDMQDADSE